MIIFFSLGNPGPLTRHSVGHYVLKNIADGLGAKQLVKKGKYSVTSVDDVMLVKSNLYMNESGELLRQFLLKERIGDSTVVVVYDDFELDLPKVRLREFKVKNESHNGIKSVWKLLQSSNHEAYKLGVGVGPKPSGASKDAMANFVLSDFKPEEKEQLAVSMDYVYQYVNEIIQSEGLVGDCNRLNSKIAKLMS